MKGLLKPLHYRKEVKAVDKARPKRFAPRKRRMDAGARTGLIYVLPAVAILALVVAYPLFHDFYLSLFKSRLFPPGLKWVGLGNYIKAIHSPLFWKVMKNTFIWTVGCVSLQFLLGFFAAIVLNERFKGRTLFRALILIPWIVPGVVAASTWKWLYHSDFGMFNEILKQLGIIDTNLMWLGSPELALFALILVNVWKMYPFVMLMILAGLQAVPRELYEAARVDGANIWQGFINITLSQIKPVLVVTLLLLIIWTFNSFTFIYVMTKGGPINSTEVMSMHIYRLGFENFQFGSAASSSVILFGVMLIFTILYLSRLSRED